MTITLVYSSCYAGEVIDEPDETTSEHESIEDAMEYARFIHERGYGHLLSLSQDGKIIMDEDALWDELEKD